MISFEKTVLAVIRPLVRFLLRKGLKYSQIDELIQRALVEESLTQIQSTNSETSISKIALVSGVHRNRAKEIIESRDFGLELKASTLSKILGHWSSDSDYLDKNGNPKLLSSIGNDSEFSKLVSSVTKQISPYTVLFELRRINSIEMVGDDKVKLILPEYWTGHSAQETYDLAARNIDSLLNAIDENLTSHHKPLSQLHLTTEYDNIEEEKLDEIKNWLLNMGEEFHKNARNYLSNLDQDINPKLNGKGNAKVSVTTFSFSSPRIEIPEIKPNKRGRKRKNG